MNHWIKQRKIKSLTVCLLGRFDSGEEFTAACAPFADMIIWKLSYSSSVTIAATYIEDKEHNILWRFDFPFPLVLNPGDTLSVNYSKATVSFG